MGPEFVLRRSLCCCVENSLWVARVEAWRLLSSRCKYSRQQTMWLGSVRDAAGFRAFRGCSEKN